MDRRHSSSTEKYQGPAGQRRGKSDAGGDVGVSGCEAKPKEQKVCLPNKARECLTGPAQSSSAQERLSLQSIYLSPWQGNSLPSGQLTAFPPPQPFKGFLLFLKGVLTEVETHWLQIREPIPVSKCHCSETNTEVVGQRTLSLEFNSCYLSD